MITVVSIVSYHFLPAKVGGQKGIALFNKYFSRYVKLICVTTSKNEASQAEGYEVLPILSNSALRYINVFYVFTILRILKKYKATHLLIEHPYYGWLAFLVKLFYPVNLVVHSHNIEALRWKTLGKWWWKILWQYERFTHRQAHYNFFIQQQDLDYAVSEFGLKPEKCIVMTYGIEWNQPPSKDEINLARNYVRKTHGVPEDECILLFNGAFDYRPNADALRDLLREVNPLLTSRNDFKYKLLICGRKIPSEFTDTHHPNVIIAGFVDDIGVYFKAAHVFLNPITDGGGIKTKLVEALGNNCNAVSTRNGAIGVDPASCNGKLQVVDDDDWKGFTSKTVESSTMERTIPTEYFEHFYWGYSTKKAAEFISKKDA